jgi:hypothetical protein
MQAAEPGNHTTPIAVMTYINSTYEFTAINVAWKPDFVQNKINQCGVHSAAESY